MATKRQFEWTFKQKVVEEMKKGVNVSALAREIGVRRKSLYEWRDAVEGRKRAERHKEERGKGPRSAFAPVKDEAERWKEVAAQLALENRFFAQALQRIEDARRRNGGNSKPSSGRSSKPSGSGKAD